MSAALYLAAVAGCGLGAVARYLLARVASPLSFPWPTVAANVLASLALGALARLVLEAGADPALTLVLGAGFCGGLSTFSTLAADAVELWRGERRRASIGYLLLTFAAGLAAAGTGWLLGAGLSG